MKALRPLVRSVSFTSPASGELVQLSVGLFKPESALKASQLPVILVHGWASTKEDWVQLPHQLLKATGRQIVTFDNPGIGESSLPLAPISLASLGQDVLSLAAALNIPKFHLMGVSMGGMVAQQIALNDPAAAVASVILGCTTHGGATALPPRMESFKTFDSWVDRCEEGGDTHEAEAHRKQIATKWLTENVSSEWLAGGADRLSLLRGEYLQGTRRSAGIKAQKGALARGNFSKVIGNVKVPTLVLHGDQDTLMPVGNAELLAEKITGAKLRVLERAGHFFWISHVKETTEAVSSFLQNEP